MSFLSGLKVFGTDIVKAFAWFGSPKGQAVVGAGEAVLEATVPISAPIVTLFNSWAAKIYGIESIAVAAGKASGTGADKAATVITAATPEALAFAQQEGLAPRTAAQIQAANDAAVAFIKAMTENPAPTPTGKPILPPVQPSV